MTVLIRSVLCQRSTNTTLRDVPHGCSRKFFTTAGALLVEGSEELKSYMQNLYNTSDKNQDFPEALLEIMSHFW